MIRARKDEGGQALAIAAVGAFVLALALALTIDWGSALVQRRIAQNDADKVAVEVGRLLTSSVGLQNGTPYFAVAGRNTTSVTRQKNLTHVEACAAAVNAYQRDRSTPVTSPAIWLDFERWSPGSSSLDPTSYVRANCAPGKPRTVAVASSTTTVRVRVEFRYKPIFASLLRQPAVVVGATSRVALAGAPYTIDPVDRAALDAQASVSQSDYADLAGSASAIVRTWPIARQYKVSDLSGKRPCGPPCDPTTATPLEFVSSSTGKVMVLDLSRQSAHGAVDQLITEPQAGTSLSDWFADGFGGVLGLETKWGPLRTPTENAAPPLEVDRNNNMCRNVPTWLAPPPSPPPSCQPDSADGDESTRGDWIETLSSSSVSMSSVVGDMHALMATSGTTTAYSTKAIPGAGGRTYGRALVVWIYLWDCAQEFQGGQQGGQWDDISCSSGADTDRVHLFSVIPVTFYEGLVTNTSIKGYWGGNFVEAGRCLAAPGSCPALTPLANSAFLVADDQRWDPTDDGVDEDQDDEDECEGGGPVCDNP